MSRIDKLSILGVRSFDNTRSEVIQFHAPLTLIVGLNGSGKTTIIECLKYATSGQTPPNSTNGAFIHDPKLCGEKEVLAQIKVSFRSTEGVRMVATRSLQLTVKKTTYSVKQLEGSLLMIRDGDRQSISSKVAEMTEMVPRFLGVSKAILDYVIFCHQDESLWPLMAPGDLKKRFDEIFEALKYTKAIENIKVMQKNQKIALVGHKKDEDHAKENKDRGERMEKQAKKLSSEIDALKIEHSEVEEKMEQASRKAVELFEESESAGQVVGQLVGKRIERSTKMESVQSLGQDLEMLEQSDEELQTMLDQYEERTGRIETDVETERLNYRELVSEITSTRERTSAKERECGSLEAQKETYDRQVGNREKLIKETARTHNIRGFDLEVDDAQVRAFVERITKMARDQNAAFERARRETQEELQQAQKVLNDINEKKSALNQRKDSSRQAIAGYDRKIDNLQSELGKINVDEGGNATMASTLQETETKLSSSKSELESSKWDEQVTKLDAELRQLDDSKEKLDSELVEGTRQAGDSARLDFVQKELKLRQQSLETMIGAHGEKIASIVGQDWTPSTIETSFQRQMTDLQSHVIEAEKQRDGTSREMEQLDYKLNTCRSELKTKQQTMKTARETIKSTLDCEPEAYDEEVKQLEEDRDTHRSDAESFARVTQYFEACEKIAREHKRCKTCMRGLDAPKEVNVLLANLAEEKKKFTFGGDVAEELKEIEKALQDAKAISSDFDAWERLKEKEIPALVEQNRTLTEKREKLVSQLEDQDGAVSERQGSKRDVDAMSRTIQTIIKYQGEISGFETQITDLTAKQKAAGLSRGLEVVQDEIKKVNEQSRTAKTTLAKVTGDRDRARNLINRFELEVRDIKSKLSSAEYQLKEKKSLDSQIDDLKTHNNEQRDAIRSVDKDLQQLGPDLSQAQVRYDDIARRGADKDRDLQAEANKLNGSLTQLKLADQEIQVYLERGGPEQLKRGKREAEALKADIVQLEEKQKRVVVEIKKHEEQLRNHSATKRSISDNQRYRRDMQQLERVEEEIAELEKHNAEEEKDRLTEEARKWQVRRNKHSAEHASLMGQLKSKDDELGRNLADWDLEYKDAARKYRESHVMVETCKACVEDLGRYCGALDNAVMKYHSLKMEEINRIVDELWRKTYQGTDVDTIIIRSETENVKSNKSYNYRVCMVKQDAEMDMRGRCSAGQKVLASIIIRLALAECFGVNCGIIALDEPTTNLDTENIRALGESLSELIKVRRAQKNFQLIVITHDEGFLRHMNCADYADVYYRVTRNERQKSEISKKNIAEVM